MERANPFEQSQEPVVLPFTRPTRDQKEPPADNKHTDANPVRNASTAHTGKHANNVHNASTANTVDNDDRDTYARNGYAGHSVNMRTRMLPYVDDDSGDDALGPGFVSSEGTMEELEELLGDEPDPGIGDDDSSVTVEDAYDDSIFDTIGLGDDADNGDDAGNAPDVNSVHNGKHARIVRTAGNAHDGHAVDSVNNGAVGSPGMMDDGPAGIVNHDDAPHGTPANHDDVFHAIDVLSMKAMPAVHHGNDDNGAARNDGRSNGIWSQEGFGGQDDSNPFKPVEVDVEDNRLKYELTRNSPPHGKHRRITNGPLGYRSLIKPPVNTPGRRKNLRGIHMDPLGVLAMFFSPIPMLGMILGVFSILRYRSNKYENGRMIPLIAMAVNALSIILLIISISLGILSSTVGGFNGPGITMIQ